VQRSSETIGTIAAALAKAQAQLANPEKSLVGTIPSAGASERADSPTSPPAKATFLNSDSLCNLMLTA
jgi:hypothetical protein